MLGNGWRKKLTNLLPGGEGDPGSEARQVQLLAINDLGQHFAQLSDNDLASKCRDLKSAILEGASLDSFLIETFGLVREIADRTIGLRPYDVQMLGGMGLHEGTVIQMDTGEGKTLAAVAPVSLNAFCGKGVHILTFNDYLAKRDAEWMGPIYRFTGLDVAYIDQQMSAEERRRAYEADITYVTAKEAGFDFLRDDLAYDVSDAVQRPFNMAIVDEADSILIDEARIPLILAGSEPHREKGELRIRDLVNQLEPQQDFKTAKGGRSVYLTEAGALHCEEILECGDLYSESNVELLTELNLALHARVLMKRDVDYIVRDKRVEIVDDFTGRVMEDRHWPYGLQTAIELKEGLTPSEDARVLRSITIQHFLLQYPKLSGMTATAESAADELRKFYNLEIITIPPNRPCIRRDLPDLLFPDRSSKMQALLAEVQSLHRTGRPVLIGTITVEESEQIARILEEEGVPCRVLNAMRDEEEAQIVAEAGEVGAVTISTNMAGRGTDIQLGGRHGERHVEVKDLGGLSVLGTNRHESRRIDTQLRGRAGRQGDPGSSRFFLSLEDDLFVRYGLDKRIPLRSSMMEQKETVNRRLLQRTIDHAQRVVEGQNLDLRGALWRFSRIVEAQRRIMSQRRKEVLKEATSLSIPLTIATHQWNEVEALVGLPNLQKVLRRLTLLSIDECWSDHIERITDIQESIHLTQIGGMDPLIEFQKRASASFDQAQSEINDRMAERFMSLSFTSEDVDLEEMGLRGPSSTWTYLISDLTYTDQLAAMLISTRHIGFAVNAAMLTPLIVAADLLSRFRRGLLSSENDQL